jgi:flavodoxin
MQRTLIVYESKYGSTEEIALLMAKILGPAICTKPKDFDKMPKGVDLVVIIAPIYSDALNHDVIEFINQNQDWLRERKVALYCVTMNEKMGMHVLDPIKKQLGDCVISSGGILGRLKINNLDAEDKKRIEMFSKNVGMSIQDFDGVSVDKLASKALELRREMEKYIKTPPREVLKEAVEKFINEHNTCVLATGSGDRIRSTPIEYNYIDGVMYIISEGGEKFANIILNHNVSLSIFNPYSGMHELGGLQLSGVASILELNSEEYRQVLKNKGLSYKEVSNFSFYLNIIKIKLVKAEFLSTDLKATGYPIKQVLFF